MEIAYLADHPDWVPVVALMHQLTMRMPSERNYDHSLQMFAARGNRDKLPIALVAIEDSIPVGSVSLVQRQLNVGDACSPWLAGLFVLAEYRKRGVADALMREAEQLAVALGHHRLYLFTHTAELYYRKRDWENIGTVHPPEVRHQSVVMQKHLR